MADRLPDPPAPERGRWPAGPLDYQQYRSLQDSYLARLERDGVLVYQRLSYLETVHKGRLIMVNLRGWVATASGGRLSINHILSVIGDAPALVETAEYVYHGYVVFSRRSGQDLFRYDNCHGDTSTLHRHCFDVEGVEVEIRPVEVDQMPGLAEAVLETERNAASVRTLRFDQQ